MSEYDIIFEALRERVNSGELTMEDAEIVNNIAYEKYVMEDGHSKKLKTRHNAKKKHIEQRFYDNMGFKYQGTTDDGTKYGTVKRGDGPEVMLSIPKKGIDAGVRKMDGNIRISRNVTRIKGSDLSGSHEYSHAIDHNNVSNDCSDERRDAEHREEQHEYMKTTGSKHKIHKAKKEQERSKRKYIKKYDKLIADNNGEFTDMSKNASKTFNVKNKHDKRANEVKADNYAVTTTHGENNTNRLRKQLNELGRRDIDSRYTKTHQNLSHIKSTVDDMDESTIKQKLLKKGLGSLIKTSKKMLQSGETQMRNNSIRDDAKRTEVNKYIIQHQRKD